MGRSHLKKYAERHLVGPIAGTACGRSGTAGIVAASLSKGLQFVISIISHSTHPADRVKDDLAGLLAALMRQLWALSASIVPVSVPS